MADKTSDTSKQIADLSRRLAKLEAAPPASGAANCSKESSFESGLGCCTLPVVPERTFDASVSSYREQLIRYIGKKWVNGSKLKYYFFTNDEFRGEPSNVKLVREAFDIWKDVGIGLEFEEVDNLNDSNVRIGFKRGDGSWSYVGRDVIDIPGANERTMNFGWDLTQDRRGDGLDTPIHEIGHTLGFPHEHQNPFSGISWDEDSVYREFGGSPNFWSRQQTFHNVLRKLSTAEVEGSEWDPNSIMHYDFGPGLIVEPAQYRNGLQPTDGLTEKDKTEALKFYPAIDARRYKKLNPLEIEMLQIGPGEQKNFVVQPDRSGEFTIQTFGKSDSLMVLFEENDGELEFVAGDDDSGSSMNAKIETRLVRGRKYVLRVRLYLNWASGDTAVMMW